MNLFICKQAYICDHNECIHKIPHEKRLACKCSICGYMSSNNSLCINIEDVKIIEFIEEDEMEV